MKKYLDANNKEVMSMNFDDILFFLKKANREDIIEQLESIYVALNLEGYTCTFIGKKIDAGYYEVLCNKKINEARHFSMFSIKFYFGFSKEKRDYISKIEAYSQEVMFPKVKPNFRLESNNEEEFREMMEKLLIEISKT